MDEVEVVVVIVQDTVIHDGSPERWYGGADDHHRVPGRQLRGGWSTAQRLIAQTRIRVMVTVSLQLIEEQVGHEMIAVPTVFGPGFDKAAVVSPGAQESVVFEIVRGFEECDARSGLEQ